MASRVMPSHATVRPSALVPALVALLLLAACTSVRSLDEPAAPLSAQERSMVLDKVHEAIADEDWTAAWNQAVEAGLDRGVFEEIALGALLRDARAEDDMMKAVRERWRGLTSAGRARVDRRIGELLGQASPDYEEAARLAIATAEDAPTYGRAMSIYGKIPAERADAAANVLKAIGDARRAHEGKGG